MSASAARSSSTPAPTTQAVAAQLTDRLSVTGGQAEVVTHAMTLAHTLAGAIRCFC